jgi:serine/threonine-protein kinase
MAHIIQAAPKASEACPEVSPLLDAPLLRMLDKNPAERFASAGEAILALRHAATQSGVQLDDTPLHLTRPEPTAISGEQLRGEPDTLLDDAAPGSQAPAAVTAGANPRPLWPFGLGLMGLAALLGFVVLRGPAPAAAPPLAPSTAPPAPAALVVAPPVSPSAATPEPAASPEAAPAKSSPPPAARPPESKKLKLKASASAHIPTDLENPF